MLDGLSTILAEQQLAVGMVSAAVAGAAVFGLKSVPSKAWTVAKDLFSTTLVIEGRDELYRYVNVWLSRSGAAARSRRLIVQDDYDYEAGAWTWRLTLGFGWHVVWAFGRPIFVNRSQSEGGELAKFLGQGAGQRLWLVSAGRSQSVLRRVVAEAERVYNGDGLVRVYFWHLGRYVLADRRAPRDLATVFLPASQKARLVADVEAFAAARETYRVRGTPYRRGYLFGGRPGTGKTSLIFALAGLLRRSVYVVNLACVGGDNDLLAAFNEVGPDGVVVIEDIDAAEISRDRAEVAAPAPGAPSASPQPQRMTLSGLLNAVDGVAAREGRVLFVTSNHADKLDPALLRAGRIDVREEVAPLGRAEAWEMFKAFRPDGDAGEFAALTQGRLPIVAAELQNLLQGEAAHA